MHGTGPPLVTPFDAEGHLDEDRLRALVGWVEDRGVDFLVPCGSNSEAELMSTEERATVVDIVVEEATVPVIAGTGHPGYRATVRQTDRAADAGADATLVVTPFYYPHDQATLAAYYRDLADEADLPIYLYSVPAFTDCTLAPETVEELATHDNIHGMKDSSGDLEAFTRERTRTTHADFDLFVGSGSVYAHALDAGADGGVLALANIAPERASEIYRQHREGSARTAHRINQELVELNLATTGRFGIPGLKAAMRLRGAPAGYARRPHRPVENEVERTLEALVEAAEP